MSGKPIRLFLSCLCLMSCVTVLQSGFLGTAMIVKDVTITMTLVLTAMMTSLHLDIHDRHHGVEFLQLGLSNGSSIQVPSSALIKTNPVDVKVM